MTEGFTDTRRIGRKPTRRQLAKQLDKQIERLYYQHAQGRQIPVLKIVQIYVAGRTAAAAGEDVEAAVIAAIAVHTEVAR
jgi:hypothetical protein